MTLIVGYRPNPEGNAALAAGIEEAQLRQSDLLVINSAEQAAGTPDAISVEHGVDALAHRLAMAGVTYTIDQLDASDDAAEALLSSVSDAVNDVLVIGIRRRTPVGKFIMGSVAQRILLEAPCPVLAVKGS